MRFLVFLWMTAFMLAARPVDAAPFGADHRPGRGDYVVLVHGLDWFRDTLQPTAGYLNGKGFETINVRYPSRKVAATCDAAEWLAQVIAEQCTDPKKKIHIVAHSMGALVVREYLSEQKPSRLGRVVLLAAPNQGTPLADALRWKPLARMISPAAAACGKKYCQQSDKLNGPGVVDYAPGVLMGNQSGWFPMLSVFIKGPDDGVVPVSSGRLDGMSDFRIVRTSHTAMPKNREALEDVNRFLRTGRFAG